MGFDTTNDPQPDSEVDLRNRDVLTDIDGGLRATLYGVLAFARDPRRYARTRNFRIECVAYAGDDRAETEPEPIYDERNKFVRVSFLLESRAH